MADVYQQLNSTLKQAGYSQTFARRYVFEMMLNGEPVSMAQLTTLCVPRIDRSSLYRTTELFERLGIVQRLQIGWKYKLELSDTFQPHHHHMLCIDCGIILTLPEDKTIEDRLNMLAGTQGFVPTDHQLEIRGRCPGCAKKHAKTTTA